MDCEGIPQRIAALRSALGLTQERLAAVLGVTFSTVSRWENGHVRPSRLAWRQLALLARQQGVDFEGIGRELDGGGAPLALGSGRRSGDALPRASVLDGDGYGTENRPDAGHLPPQPSGRAATTQVP